MKSKSEPARSSDCRVKQKQCGEHHTCKFTPKLERALHTDQSVSGLCRLSLSLSFGPAREIVFNKLIDSLHMKSRNFRNHMWRFALSLSPSLRFDITHYLSGHNRLLSMASNLYGTLSVSTTRKLLLFMLRWLIWKSLPMVTCAD